MLNGLMYHQAQEIYFVFLFRVIVTSYFILAQIFIIYLSFIYNILDYLNKY